MTNDPRFITVTGARENNLKNLSVKVPKGKITVFTGVSGSGKSSLVFDTIAAEAQRQLNETFTTFMRGFLPSYGQPDIDSIENLSAAIVIDQKRLSGNSRSTVGTITDINPLLRALFAKAGEPRLGGVNAFSFNDPAGMCPECDGIGVSRRLDFEKFVDTSKSLNGGALLHPDFRGGKGHGQLYTVSGYFDNDKPLNDYSEQEWQTLLHGTGKIKATMAGVDYNLTYEGLIDKFDRVYFKKEVSAMSERNRDIFLQYTISGPCTECGGSRLSANAREVRVEGNGLAELTAMEVSELSRVVAAFQTPIAAQVGAKIVERLDHLVAIGLGYLSLDRSTPTLSGGESQRLKLVRHLGSALTGMLYVLDEPSVGLHPRDVRRLNELLCELRDKGNTVLVVEHDRDVIQIADHVIDVGPLAGAGGGEIVFEGSVERLAGASTLTGTFLRNRLDVKTYTRSPSGWASVSGAAVHNLKNVSVDIPLGVLTVVTGVAGSGKSSLINGAFLAAHPEAVVIDQATAGGSRRSSVATYSGVMDEIRRLFATANKVSPSKFSFNSTGACPDCQGLGVVYTELAFMADITSTCESCGGRRFTAEVLGYRLRGKSISDVLQLTIADACEFFTEVRINTVVRALDDVGLGYVALGQPLSTLSGGESQRLKLAAELHKVGTIYLMDEPTTGLHMSDIGRLLGIVDRMVDAGSTVVMIEHDLDVIKRADWIIDMGPDAGAGGGRVMFEGTPTDLLEASHSLTAEFVRRDIGWTPTNTAA